MSVISKFDFQKRKQLRFSEVHYLNYTKKDSILHVATTFSLKQGETRTSHGPIPHPLSRGGRKRLPKFKFSAKFPIGLHVILQIQIKKFENDCYLM